MLADVLNFVRDCTLAFVPMFFAVDAIGVLPLYIGLTDGMEKSDRRRVLWESVATALAVAVGFLLFGRSVFKLMNVTVADFMVAGGALLFLLATMDMVSAQKPARLGITGVGAVPLGTPLIAGPAVLAMSLILVDLYGWAATIIAVAANVLLTGLILTGADLLIRILGKTGVRVASKVSSLLLAAFAVMMVRKGLTEMIAQIGASVKH
jgi:multiple antibiotic resistance protein